MNNNLSQIRFARATCTRHEFNKLLLKYIQKTLQLNEPPIEFKFYPKPAFYSKIYDKIFLSPLIKNYPNFYKYTKRHETNHFYFSKLIFPISFILNVCLEWIDLFNLTLRSKLRKEANEFQKESYQKCSFTAEELKSFEEEFYPFKKLSLKWIEQKGYELLRPDSYIGGPLVIFFLTRWVLSWDIPFISNIPKIIIEIIPYLLSLWILHDIHRIRNKKYFRIT